MKEPFLINPPKSLGRKQVKDRRIGREGSLHRPRVYVKRGRWKTSDKARVAWRSHFINPVGETLITVGGNPMSNPMRFFHRRRKNPVTASLKGAMDVRNWAPLAVTGALSAAATAAVPPMLGITGEWTGYGAKLAVAFGGGMLVGNFVDKQHGSVWAVVGTSLVAYDLLKKYVLSTFPGFVSGPYNYEGYQEGGDSQVNAFPNQVSAYPDQGGMQAFPLGSYPYDGSYGSYVTMT